ncbi:MAG: ABC transporter ATP-binding protein, partial [Novosphingobium sp.]
MTFWQSVIWSGRFVPARWLVALAALMTAVSLLEGIGVLLLVPLLAILSGAPADNQMAQALLHGFGWFGLRPTITTILGAFVALVTVRAVLGALRDQFSNAVQLQAVDEIRSESLRMLLAAEWRWLARQRRSDYAALVTIEVSRLGLGVRAAIALAAALTGLLAYLAVAFMIAPTMSVIALLSGLILYALLYRVRRRAVRLGEETSRVNRAMMGTVEESLGALKLAKVLRLEARYLNFLTGIFADIRKAQSEYIAVNAYAQAIWQIMASVLLAGYVYAGYAWLHADTPTLLSLVVVFGRLSPIFLEAQRQVNQLLHAVPLAQSLSKTLAEAKAAAAPRMVVHLPPIVAEREIRLDDVSMTYHDRDRAALSHVSLTFPARSTTAIIGKSGAGKSTLADILVGLVAPDSGEVLVDGKPLSGEERDRWLTSISYIPQEVTLFHDTIRGNLLWGR